MNIAWEVSICEQRLGGQYMSALFVRSVSVNIAWEVIICEHCLGGQYV